MAALILSLLLLITPTLAAPIATEFIYPNFTASNFLFVDTRGVFLTSPKSTFKAAIINPISSTSAFYLLLTHAPTATIVWSANRGAPISNSGTLNLTPTGLAVSRHDGSLAWSTPPLSAPVHALRLLDNGNLVLLDANNLSLWQSFDHPTDTLLSSQPLFVGASLISPVSYSDLSEGEYSMLITPSDVFMRWTTSQTYWSFSLDGRAVKYSNATVSYMGVNGTGLYLFSSKGEAVYEVPLQESGFRIMKLDSRGQFCITSYDTSSSQSVKDDNFVAPSSNCDLPFSCKTLGLCVAGSNSSICTCPGLFGADAQSGGCSPDGEGYVLASCANWNGSSASYLRLGSKVGYFGNKFASPISSGEDIGACRSRCSGNCSCLGFFYMNSSRSCCLLENQLGSLSSISSGVAGNSLGFIKVLDLGSSPRRKIRLVAVLLPSMAAFLLIIMVLLFVGSMWWRRMKKRRFGLVMGWQNSRGVVADCEGSDDEEITIPGLPTRFSYAELEAATGNFQFKIGSGGFGTVYKGVLPDGTLVVVKRINREGMQRRREFCAEIAVIGQIHHINLVRLRGFCAEGARRLMVYEYMSRGSLDLLLFGPGPVLEWQERVDIAVGAARGLAYLHSGCDHCIIHCDVKPENILLHEGGQVKIADFGLAKLLTTEQSGRFTTMRGTRGYLAPEWLTNSPISEKSDVYSYGMVLLEIVKGRKNRSEESESTQTESAWSRSGYFPMMALEMHERGQYLELADPRLEGRVTAAEVGLMVRLALCCLHEDPALRPSMVALVRMLEGDMNVCEPRVESLSFLRLYGQGSTVDGNGSGMIGSAHRSTLIDSSVISSTTNGSGSLSSSQAVSGPR